MTSSELVPKETRAITLVDVCWADDMVASPNTLLVRSSSDQQDQQCPVSSVDRANLGVLRPFRRP